MKISNSLVTFRIDIDFDEADVDAVYQEARLNGFAGIVPIVLMDTHTHTVNGNKTPTAESVEFCLKYLMGCTCQISKHKWEISNYINPLKEFIELGVKVKKTYGLMMGTCHLIFEVPAEKYSNDLVKKVELIVFKVFEKFIKYYKNKTKLTV